MYTIEDLKQQNQEISELCDVLCVLMDKPELHDNPHVSDLLNRFKEKVWMHLVFEDNILYAELARHQDERVSEVAKQFHENARLIKHRFAEFVKHWCRPAITETEHANLQNECSDIFQMVRERIAFENEKMFPLLK